MNTIYFDNAATSWPKPESMMQAMVAFNANVGANPGRSGHRLSIEAGRIVFDARESVASLLGAKDPFTVVFSRNATEAINIAVRGLLKAGDHVITTGMEHNSVMRPLREAEREGIELEVVPCSPTGVIEPDDMARAIKKNTKALFVTHASNVTGTIMPVRELAAIARERGVITCVDAAQTAGSVPIDVERDAIDILFFTGHKSLYGPQGTGGMYIREGLESLVAPLERGGTGSRSEFEEHPDFMPDRFESGTPNAIGIAGLGAGVRHIMETGIENIRSREMALTGLFMEGLAALGGVRVHGPGDSARKTAVTSFTVEGMSTSDISFELDERFGIMTRPGLHCAPSAHRTVGTFPGGTVRCSFGMYTTEEEILAALRAIEMLVSENT
ncbi:MAG: aminotransferase class V-fold PLP-dependent enzyme [Spirochaetes bacterium]|nr:aminotransferase class V-fold PLP-dependent enzyme [Spirochaetota bacterium]